MKKLHDLAAGYWTCFSFALLIFISGCAPDGRPVEVSNVAPAVSLALAKPVGRLMGVNHLSTITGYFSQPVGVAVDVEGNLYVADSGKSVIHVLDRESRLLESIGRFGWRSGEFDRPTGIAVDSQLRLYIADSGNNRVQKVSLIDRNFSTIFGEERDETGTSESLYEPQGVAVDSRGYVYIADTWNHRILNLDPLGRPQMEIGGLGWSGQQFRNPQGVMVDFKGNIYISDTGNHRVHKLDFSGIQLAIWGEEGSGEGQFQHPAGQSIDRFGNIYVADTGNRRIQIFDSEGLYLTEFGREVLKDPVDVAVDNSLRVYVTDAAAGDIEVFKVIYEMAEDIR
ncbi:NHL repeat-containing protein [Candidatus Poribacteria bacterium]